MFLYGFLTFLHQKNAIIVNFIASKIGSIKSKDSSMSNQNLGEELKN